MNRKQIIIKICGILLLLVCWELFAQIIRNFFPSIPEKLTPTIIEVLTIDLPGISIFAKTKVSTISLVGKGTYIEAFTAIIIHSGFTLFRFFTGLISGILLGISLGVIVALYPKFRMSLEPFINYLRTMPLLALITIFLVWFGKEEIGRYLFSTFAITVILFVNTVVAVRNLDPIYLRFARTLGASKTQLIKTIILPGIIPELSGGIRVILGTGWAIVLAAEFIAAQNGLGRILILSQLYFSPGRMLVIIVVFMIYSLILNRIAIKMINYITRWKNI